MVEAVRTSEKLVNLYKLHSATTQRTQPSSNSNFLVILKLANEYTNKDMRYVKFKMQTLSLSRIIFQLSNKTNIAVHVKKKQSSLKSTPTSFLTADLGLYCYHSKAEFNEELKMFQLELAVTQPCVRHPILLYGVTSIIFVHTTNY